MHVCTIKVLWKKRQLSKSNPILGSKRFLVVCNIYNERETIKLQKDNDMIGNSCKTFIAPC